MHRLSRLGVKLTDSPKDGFRVHHSSESSFVVDVNSNKHHDTISINLIEFVLSKSVENLSQEGYLSNKVDYVFRIWIT